VTRSVFRIAPDAIRRPLDESATSKRSHRKTAFEYISLFGSAPYAGVPSGPLCAWRENEPIRRDHRPGGTGWRASVRTPAGKRHVGVPDLRACRPRRTSQVIAAPGTLSDCPPLFRPTGCVIPLDVRSLKSAYGRRDAPRVSYRSGPNSPTSRRTRHFQTKPPQECFRVHKSLQLQILRGCSFRTPWRLARERTHPPRSPAGYHGSTRLLLTRDDAGTEQLIFLPCAGQQGRCRSSRTPGRPSPSRTQ
jgi:hypothetical protein